jgi:heme-degrading monooxygenase HmoA
MIRVLYRWSVVPGAETEFAAWWSQGTTRIRNGSPGAMGSVLMRPRAGNVWTAVARWRTFDDWSAFRAAVPDGEDSDAPWRMVSAEPFDEVEDQTILG